MKSLLSELRKRRLTGTLWVLGTLLGVYMMARAIAWPFSVDPSDPATYASDWGGPTLIGAAAVHSGPGVIAALLLVGFFVRGRRSARARRSIDTRHS